MSSPITTTEQARHVVGSAGGGRGASSGEELYQFVHEHKFTSCLELGFAHGVSCVYIAAALEANGNGSLTSVDIPSALERDPLASDLLASAGLSHRVQLVIDPDSYVWWLRKQLREQLREGHIQPAYDFVFIDGAHTWDADGLAFSLVDRLLEPGGWVLFDDLDWRASDPDSWEVPQDTRELAHVGEIWELLVATDQSYDELRSDGTWGYARKSTSPTPVVRTVVKHDLVGQARELMRIARMKIRR
jgi:predicted O-methyltransferase YrrM